MSASKIVKTWVTGDEFLASDQETINKNTINDIIDDNEEGHVLEKGSGVASVKGENALTADGANSLALGFDTKADGTDSVAGGVGTEVYSLCGFGFGNECHVDANYGVAFGNECVSRGNHSFVCGQNNQVNGENSAIIGGSGLSEFEDGMVQIPNLRIADIQQNNDIYNILAIDSSNKIVSRWYAPYGALQSYVQAGNIEKLNTVYEDLQTLSIPIGSYIGVYKIEFFSPFDMPYASTNLSATLSVDSTVYQEHKNIERSSRNGVNFIYYYTLSDNTVAHTITIQTKNNEVNPVTFDTPNLSYVLVAIA